MRVFHDVSTNVALFSFSFLRMLVSFIFSPDYREVFACFLKTVTQLSYYIRMSVTKISYCKFTKFCGNRFATLARTSYDCRTKVLQNILTKKFA